jgi:hypothetical protein
MLLSKDRLAELQEQNDYLEQMYDFAFDRNVLRLGKQGVANDRIKGEATVETDIEFEKAGLDKTQDRIRLEIDFLTDYMS